MIVLKRIVSMLGVLALLLAGAPSHALMVAAHQALGADDMCLTSPPDDGADTNNPGHAAPLPCADCCLALQGSLGPLNDLGRETPLRHAFHPAPLPAETVTTVDVGEDLSHVLWIRGPPRA